MYVSSKFPTGRLLAAGLAIILWVLGIHVLQATAKDKNHSAVETQNSCQTCPVDPKEVAKQKKAEEHAQHEAAEACQRRQKEIAHAQHEVEEAQAKVAHEQQELTDLGGGGMCCAPTEAAVEKTQPEPERAKPTPEPAPIVEAPPAPPAVIEVPVPPEPAPAPPKEMPKTASPMGLIGLIGLVSMSGGYLTRFFRR